MTKGGPSGVEQRDVTVLERRGRSGLVLVLVVVAAIGVAVAALRGGATDTEAVPAPVASTTTTAAATTTTAVVPASTPDVVRRLGAADTLPSPVWFAAGRTPERAITSIVRLDDTGVSIATAKSRDEQGRRVPVVRLGDTIAWSDGEHLVRIDDELEQVPFVLRNARNVVAATGDDVWIVDDEGIRRTDLVPATETTDLGPAPGPVLAALGTEGFVLAVDGAAGVWWPETPPARIATAFLDTDGRRTVFSQDGRLLFASNAPFFVADGVAIDREGLPLGPGALSPDGTRIAYHLMRGGRFELVVSDLDDGTTTPSGVFTDRQPPVWLDDDRLVVLGAPSEKRVVAWLVPVADDASPSVPLAELLGDRTWTTITGGS